jgi:hypothetical protein
MEQTIKPPRNSKPPLTSKLTYAQVQEFRKDHWAKILMAMAMLDAPSSAEKIAEKANLDPVAVSRRMGELVFWTFIYVNGKGINSKNKTVQLYSLVKKPALSEVKEQEPVETNQNQLSFQDFL